MADRPAEGSLPFLLFEAAPDAMIAVGANGKIITINGQAEVMFGYSRDELVGQFVEKLLPERYRQRHVYHRDGYFAYPRIRPMGLGLNLYGLTKDGAEFPVEISLSPVDDKTAVATVRDITAWRRILNERAPGSARLSIPLVYTFMVFVATVLVAVLAVVVAWR